MDKPDVTEVKTLLDNLQFLEKQLSNAISNWKKNIKSCDLVIQHPKENILKQVCENPKILNTGVFGSLYSFLNTYINIREGKIALTGGLDPFLLKGLRAMQNYIVIADFFARNPYYLYPSVSISQGIEAAKKSGTEQERYKDFIFTLNEKLIGCKEDLNFMFLKLIGTVKNMNEEMQGLKNYLNDKCLSIRIERLKM